MEAIMKTAMHLVASGSPADRGGNVLHVFLIAAGLIAFVALAFGAAMAAGWIVENALPLMWLSGLVGVVLLIVGYIIGVIAVIWVGGVCVGAPIAIYAIAALFEV
jgi:hypothetical protein